MWVYKQTRGQSLGYKGEAGDNGIISAATAEISPRAYSLTMSGERGMFLWYLEAWVDTEGVVHLDYTLALPMVGIPGFESYSDRNPPTLVPNGAAAFKHDGQLKAAILHFRGERPKGSQRNDNTRDLYVYRSGLYLTEVSDDSYVV